MLNKKRIFLKNSLIVSCGVFCPRTKFHSEFLPFFVPFFFCPPHLPMVRFLSLFPFLSLFLSFFSSPRPLFLSLLPFSAFCYDLATICKSSFDCDFVEGMICSMALCVPSKCHLSSECPTGWVCTSQLQCRRGCFSDDDCALIGWFCTAQNVCEQGDCGDCRMGEKCVEGKCIPKWFRGMKRK